MDFLIASHNKKKRDELERILKPLGINVLFAEQAGINLTDVPETGETFEQEAGQKRVICLALPMIQGFVWIILKADREYIPQGTRASTVMTQKTLKSF